MKHKKKDSDIYHQFEKYMNENPELKGGNTLQKTNEAYGIKLTETEYCSSWVQDQFEQFKTRINQDK